MMQHHLAAHPSVRVYNTRDDAKKEAAVKVHIHIHAAAALIRRAT